MSSLTDPIADMLTRIRNAQNIQHEEVVIPISKIKASLARILKREGYIQDFSVDGTGIKKVLRLRLRYVGRIPAITGLRRVSRPGRRRYAGAKERLPIRGGMGVTILSTSRGLMTEVEARKAKVGGEVLCSVW